MSATVSKWTPGPWVVSVWTPTRVDTADGGISVAWNGGPERIARAETNARLIAEAPAMAELLEQFCAPLAGVSDDDLRVYGTRSRAHKVLAARALLARAKGEGA